MALWLLALIAAIGWVVLYHLLNAGDDGAGVLKNTFGLVSLLAGAAGLLILVRYRNLFDMTPTKATSRDKAGFILAALGLVAALLGLLN